MSEHNDTNRFFVYNYNFFTTPRHISKTMRNLYLSILKYYYYKLLSKSSSDVTSENRTVVARRSGRITFALDMYLRVALIMLSTSNNLQQSTR